MGEVKVPGGSKRRPLWRAVLLFALWMVFGIALIQSLTVAVAWWQGGFETLGVAETVWVVLFPILLFVYIRRFSIFRAGCTTCAAPDDKSARHLPRGP